MISPSSLSHTCIRVGPPATGSGPRRLASYALVCSGGPNAIVSESHWSRKCCLLTLALLLCHVAICLFDPVSIQFQGRDSLTASQVRDRVSSCSRLRLVGSPSGQVVMADRAAPIAACLGQLAKFNISCASRQYPWLQLGSQQPQQLCRAVVSKFLSLAQSALSVLDPYPFLRPGVCGAGTAGTKWNPKIKLPN